MTVRPKPQMHRHQRRAVVRKTAQGTRRPWKQWRDVWRESSRGRRKPFVRVVSR
ncbi:MAG: hypothetical protein V3R71_01610 [Gemmatimonadales bacterium]